MFDFRALSLHTLVVALVLLIVLPHTTTTSAAGIYGRELTSNGGAESTGLSGWTKVKGTPVNIQYGQGPNAISAPSGCGQCASAFFRGTGTVDAEMTQTIDLATMATSSELLSIDTGTIQVTFACWLGGWGSETDYGIVTFSFLDASQASLGSSTSFSVTKADRGGQITLLSRSTVRTIPTGCRAISVTYQCVYASGSQCNGYVDVISVKLASPPCSCGTVCPSGAPCPAGSFCAASSGTFLGISCSAGDYCPSSSCAPTACSSGSYCPARSTSNADCPAGSYCSTTTVKVTCSTGSYCPARSTAEGDCVAGSYCSTPATSIACTSGSYCPARSTANTNCPAGSYCSTPSVTAVCGSGSYCPARSVAEADCAAGSYCATPATQVACTSGSYCPARSIAEASCSVGSYCSTPSVTAVCSSGSYCPARSTSNSDCPVGCYCSTPLVKVTCSSGSYCAARSIVEADCAAGSYCSTPSTSIACSSGSYCPVRSTSQGDCSAGSYCSTPSVTAVCSSGSYCPARSVASVDCPAGFYCSTPAVKALCPAGSYCPTRTVTPVRCASYFYCGRPGMIAPSLTPSLSRSAPDATASTSLTPLLTLSYSVPSTLSSLVTVSPSHCRTLSLSVRHTFGSDSVSITRTRSGSRSRSMSVSSSLGVSSSVQVSIVSQSDSDTLSLSLELQIPRSEQSDLVVAARVISAISIGIIVASNDGPIGAMTLVVLTAIPGCNNAEGYSLSDVVRQTSLFGPYGIVVACIGPIVLGGLLALLHLLGVSVVTLVQRRRSKANETITLLGVSGELGLRFPSLSILAMELLIPGAVFAAVAALLATEVGVGEKVWASIAVTAAASFALWRQYLVSDRVLPNIAIVSYAAAVFDTGGCDNVPRTILPRAFWCPSSMRSLYGTLFNSFSAHIHVKRLSTLDLVIGMTTAIGGVLSLAYSSQVCLPFMACLTVVFLACGAIYAFAVPFRVPAENIVIPLQYLLLAGIGTCKAVRGGQQASEVLQLIQTLLTLCRGLMLLYVRWKENNMMEAQKSDVPGRDEDGIDDDDDDDGGDTVVAVTDRRESEGIVAGGVDEDDLLSLIDLSCFDAPVRDNETPPQPLKQGEWHRVDLLNVEDRTGFDIDALLPSEDIGAKTMTGISFDYFIAAAREGKHECASTDDGVDDAEELCGSEGTMH